MISGQPHVTHRPVADNQGGGHRRKHRVASVAVATILAETLLISGSVVAASASTTSIGVNPAKLFLGFKRAPHWCLPLVRSVSL